MGEEIPVFDEWGMEVGKFIPAGSGCLDSIFLFIALVIAWTIGFLIYLFIKLIVKGFSAAKEGDWENALMYWLVPGLLAFFLVASMIGGVATAAAEQRQRQKAEEQRQQEVQQALEQLRQDPLSLVTVTNVKRQRQEDIRGSGSVHDNNIYVVFTVTNNWRGPVSFRVDERDIGERFSGDGSRKLSCWLASALEPFEKRRVACDDLSVRLDSSGRNLELREGYENPLKELCVRFELNVSRSDILWGETLPALRVCEEVPQQVYFPMGSQESAAHDLVAIQEAELLQHKEFDSRCGPTGGQPWCYEVDGIKYTVVNNWSRSVTLKPGYYYLQRGQYGTGGRQYWIELEPGQTKTLYQWLTWADECITVETDGLPDWRLCPLDYVNK